jgi:hypothetical protein
MQNSKQTFDCTPTWESLLPAMIHLIESGGKSSSQVAKEELQKMAQAADKYNVLVQSKTKGGNND